MIEEDAQDEHLAHNEKLEEQEYSKVLYDNIFKSQKDIGDDNLEYYPTSQLVRIRQMKELMTNKLLTMLLLLNLKAIHGWIDTSYITLLW